ncbi:MAG: hypothetical protein H6855_01300 [Rhodospirillales bacterium]|nr:hypothetical protein [Rhodospirillales bacterium]MCB9964706.1 hypothetical protein [Rhodospirillales bacterium]MCB9980070.1 hypothetical protein [Rhodospirillales bacterium]
MSTNTIFHSRQKIVQTALSAALEQAICSYELFVSEHTPDPQNPKEFEEHHKACKSALTHIELLTKLIKAADLSAENPERTDPVIPEDLMQQSLRQIEADLETHTQEED